MREPTEPKNIEGLSYGDGVNIFGIFLRGYNACFLPFLRTGMGKHAMGFAGPVALGIMFFYIGLGECVEVIPYMGCWIVACIFQRIISDSNQHSRYKGWPAVASFLFHTKNEGLAKILEGLLVIGIGYGVSRVALSLGTFIGVGGFFLLFAEVTDGIAARARARRMRDSMIIQREMVEDFRGGRW